MKRILVFGMMVGVLAGCGEQTPEQKAASDAAMTEIRTQRMAREFVSAHLKDPGSAEYRNQDGFCGEVNSKNSFGAFTGYQRFIAGSAQLVVLERDGGLPTSEFNGLWGEFCS